MRSPVLPENNRVVRVVISSTFQDMHAERDELVKFVFPELRRRCRERGVEFVDVDLRWGITDEQKAEGKVLPICLAEIERCRPYFIGLLGERYGWVPEGIDDVLAEVQPWLKEHKEKSVTELEIMHGVLQDPGMKGLAFFYIRDQALSEQIEAQLAGKADYQPETPESAAKLTALKSKIRSSGYPVRENYSDTKAFGTLVLDDLWKAIEERFPQAEVPSALERERMEHEAFAEVRRKIYIGREEYFRRLDAHINTEDQPLVILGDSGTGKSALLANWAARHRKQHSEDFMVEHYIGSQADSADYVRILRRIMEEIQERYEPKSESTEGMIPSGRENENDIPVDPKKVVEVFPVWLAKSAERGRFILIIDALNQTEDRDNVLDLGWLPRYFPPNVRVILSTLPGRSLNALKERNWPLFSLEPLNDDERKQLIVTYLGRYSRSLSAAYTERIMTAAQSGNPLFLKVLLDELRVYWDHRTLGDRIGYYLGVATIDGLYELILSRYEQDYESDRPGLVRDAMSLIWASRRGLIESELLELLGTNGNPLRRASWSPLFLATEEALISKSGMLNFFHDYLRAAVEARYLNGKELQQAAHLKLADYFEKRQLDERKVDEFPWQLRQAESWERLKDCTTDVKTFLVLLREKQYELMGYWLGIGSRFDIGREYGEMLDTYEITAPAAADLAVVLNETAFFFGSM